MEDLSTKRCRSECNHHAGRTAMAVSVRMRMYWDVRISDRAHPHDGAWSESGHWRVRTELRQSSNRISNRQSTQLRLPRWRGRSRVRTSEKMAPAQVCNLPTGAVLHLTDFHVRRLYFKAGTCWMGLTVRLIKFYFQGPLQSTILPGASVPRTFIILGTASSSKWCDVSGAILRLLAHLMALVSNGREARETRTTSCKL